MRLQVTLLLKGPFTYPTYKRPIFSMQTAMSFQTSMVSKRLPTVVTSVRFISSVQTKMILQMPFLRKPPSTCFTFKRSRSSVKTAMLYQIRFKIERFPTCFTSVGLFPSVYPGMTSQAASKSKRLPTFATFVRFLRIVFSAVFTFWVLCFRFALFCFAALFLCPWRGSQPRATIITHVRFITRVNAARVCFSGIRVTCAYASSVTTSIVKIDTIMKLFHTASLMFPLRTSVIAVFGEFHGTCKKRKG